MTRRCSCTAPTEIAEVIALPDTLSQQWFNRGYYGTMSHNTKAIYQRYMGWYDGNPAHLKPAPDSELSAEVAGLVTRRTAHRVPVDMGHAAPVRQPKGIRSRIFERRP